MEEDAFETPHIIKAAVSKVLNETYLAISEESQYVYFRNYMKRIVIFSLNIDIPKNIFRKLPHQHPFEINQERVRSIDRFTGGIYYDLELVGA